MKKFKIIEKKDPYENISPNNLIVRRFPDIRKGINYFKWSLIGIAVVALLHESPILEMLSEYEFFSSCILLTCIVTVIWSSPGVVFGIALAPFILIRFMYNLIVKKVIGVDIYYDYITLSRYISNKFIDPIFEEDDDYEFDDFNDDDEDFCEDDYDDEEDNEDNVEYESNCKIINVNFTKREP